MLTKFIQIGLFRSFCNISGCNTGLTHFAYGSNASTSFPPRILIFGQLLFLFSAKMDFSRSSWIPFSLISVQQLLSFLRSLIRDGKKNAFQNMWLSPLFYILSHIQSSLLVYLSPFSIGLFLHSLPVLYFLILPTLSPHFPFSSHTLSSPLPSPPVFPTSQSCLLISRWISQEILVSEQFL